MTILDRYVLRLYLGILLIAFISLTGLFIVVDAFNNLDEFIAGSKQAGGPFVVLGSYYGARTLWFFDRMSGVLGMVAAMFTLTMMQRNNEMTALMAAGISRSRVVQPLIGAVLFVSVLGLVNREFGLPNVRDKLTRNAQDLLVMQRMSSEVRSADRYPADGETYFCERQTTCAAAVSSSRGDARLGKDDHRGECVL